LKGDFGELELETPRDRQASFEPKIVAKGQTRFTGFDDKIISMYARGMSTREIQGHLEEIYGIEVSPSLISHVTDAVVEEGKAWQSRPLEELYPIVFLVRASLNYVPWKHRKWVAADLRRIYRAATAEEANQNLEEVTLKWNAYPSLSQVWQRNWDRITPFFHYPADIRKAIYTTNSVEALHRSLRKIIKTRGAFPNEESALKLLFLAIRQASKKWTMPVQNWSQALNYFTVLWPERMPRPGRSA